MNQQVHKSIIAVIIVTLVIILLNGELLSEDRVITRGAFEKSELFKVCSLSHDSDWKLRDGGHNYVYNIKLIKDITFEVTCNKDTISSFGISFYERRVLSEKDLDFVYALLSYISPDTELTKYMKRKLALKVTNKYDQINESKPIAFGSYLIYCGTVGGSEIFSIERI